MAKAKRPSEKRKKRKKPESPVTDKLTTFLQGHRKTTLLSFLALAFLLRLGFFIEASSDFPVSLHKWPQSDMSFFHEWANRIKGGDILTDTIYHPFHGWHSIIADAYFANHPGEKEALIASLPEGVNYAHAHMNEWMGGLQFHQEPFYPYFIALTYALMGSSPLAVFTIQSMLGLVTLLLLFLVTDRNFGILAAVSAVVLAALSGIFFTYEFTLLRAPVVTFFTILLIYWFQRTMDKSTAINWILLGVIAAFSLLTKITFLLFFLGIAIWFPVSKSYRAHSGKNIALGILAFVLAFSPLLLRNAIVGAPLLSTNSVGSITAVSPNLHANTTGEFWVDGEIYADILERTDASTIGSFIEAAKTHPSIFSFAGSLLRRAEQAFRWRVYTDNVNHLFWKEKFTTLKIAGINFWLISPLALTGIVFCFYPVVLKKAWPLTIMMLATLAPLVLFYVLERYRLPFLIVLMPFAGYGVSQLIRPGNARNFLIAAIIFIASFVWSNELLKSNKRHPEQLIREVDLVSSFQYHYRPKMDVLTDAAQYSRALDLAIEYRTSIPEYLFEFSATQKPVRPQERGILEYVSRLHQYFAQVADAAGDQATAQEMQGIVSRMQSALN